MKRRFLILFLAGAITTGYAQTGNVGIGTTTPGSKLTINGSLAAAYRLETGTTGTIGTNDFYVVWNGAGNGALTLPAAVSGAGNYKGRLYYIKNTTTSNNLTLSANGSELIEGAASISIPSGYAVNLVNTGATSGTTWEVVSFMNTTGIPQFRTTSVIASTGSATITGNTSTPVLLPGMSVTVNNPTGKSLNYLINCNLALDAGFAAPVNASNNMYIHMLPVLYVDGEATAFRTFLEAEPVTGNNSTSSNFIGSLNGTVLLTPGSHTIEIRYTISAFGNVSTYDFSQAGSVITATTIH